MELLLTGGAGYIGSHTAVALLEAGHGVTLLDNFLNSSRRVPERIRHITGRDLTVCEADAADGEAARPIRGVGGGGVAFPGRGEGDPIAAPPLSTQINTAPRSTSEPA